MKKRLGNGPIGGQQQEALRAHLESCPAGCASKLSASDWVEIWPALEAGVEPSEDFDARFHARLRERKPEPAGLAWWRAFGLAGWPKQLLAAGSLAAILAAGVFVGKYGGRTADHPGNYRDFAVAEKLPLLQDMAVINNLDMLEDLDVIESLPAVPAERE